MIRLDHVSFRYPDAETPVLRSLDLVIPEGELCLVIGETGSGKSTLLHLVNGLAPHFTGGLLTGTVTVAGLDTRHHPPRELAGIVGVVGQDPLAGFVTDTVEEELAYSMEQQGLPNAVMRTRVEEIVDLLGLADLRNRRLHELSGGQQQRVAIGSVLTSHPTVLILDEPTSALDPTAAEEVLAMILRLVHDLGTTVLLAEHRLERVIQYADSIIALQPDGTARYGIPAEILSTTSDVPPIIELARVAGWEPLPLSVRDARKQAAALRVDLARIDLARIDLTKTDLVRTDHVDVNPNSVDQSGAKSSTERRASEGEVRAQARRLRVEYGSVTALDGIDLRLRAGEVTVVMGRNGSGKSSLLWALQGSGVRTGGTVTVAGADGKPVDPARLQPSEARQRVAFVPQTPADLLYLDTVEAECEQSDRTDSAHVGTTAELLRQLSPGIAAQKHPRDLSEGQRLALTLAIQLAAAPALLLLDEPTRGLDYSAKRRLSTLLTKQTDAGVSVLLSSHDVEFAARVADRVIVLADGQIVADGPALEVLTASPGFAPQVARILNPLRMLTVDAVRAALEGSRS